MLTVEKLRDYGANVDEGMGRCLNNEAFYLKMVNMGIGDASFGKLEDAISAGDLNAGFEAAHALKGIMGNLALTPILNPVSEMTELLRARTETDYSELLAQVKEGREKLLVMAAE